MGISGSETRRRQVQLRARFSRDEAAAIEARADRMGLSVSALIRSALLDTSLEPVVRRPTERRETAARLLGALGGVAQALREAGKVVGKPESHGLIDAAARDLSELRVVCFEALGREP